MTHLLQIKENLVLKKKKFISKMSMDELQYKFVKYQKQIN